MNRIRASLVAIFTIRKQRPLINCFLVALIAAWQICQPLQAATFFWDGDDDATWAGGNNWNPTGVPGTTDVAVFNAAGNGNVVIDLGAGVTVGGISFEAASAVAYTIGAGAVGSQSLTLDNGGSITMASNVVAGQLINANITLGNDDTASTYTLDNDSTTSSLTLAGAITGSSVASLAGAKVLDVTGNGATILSGVISDGGATSLGIIKSGTGKLTLTEDSTFTGNILLNEGILEASNIAAKTGALGAGTLTLNGGTLRLLSDASTNYGRSTTVTANSTIQVSVFTNDDTVTAKTHTLGALSIGEHTLTVQHGGNSNGTGDMQLTFGATTLTGNAVFNIVNADSGTQANLGAVNDGGNNYLLTKSGNGVLFLNGAGSYTGGTTLNAGTLVAAVADSLGTAGSTITINGGTLQFRNVNSGAGRTFDLHTSTAKTINLRSNSNATFNIGTLVQTGNGTLTISASRNSGATGSQTIILNEDIALNGNLILTASAPTTSGNTTFRFQGAITEASGSRNVVFSSTANRGIVILETAADYSGTTDLDNGITRMGVANALPSGAGKGDLTFSPDTATEVAVLDLNGFNQTVNGLSNSGANLGTSTIDNTAAGAVTFTIGGNGGSGTFTGVIQDTGGDLSLTKIGSGLITLAGVNTYAGATTVDGGALVVHSGSLANTSGVTIGVNGDGILAFGDGTGDLTTLASGVNLILGGAGSSGNLAFQLGANTASSDRILLQGGGTLTVAAGGGFISGVNLGTLTAGSYDLITGANAVVGFGNLALGSLPGGFTYTLSNTGGGLETVTLNVTAAAGGDLFWKGDVDSSWATLAGGTNSNWTTDLGGTTDGGFTPGVGNTVNFSASSAANFSTTLDNNYGVAGLNILSGGSEVTIASGVLGALTIGTGGIDIQTGAPAVTTISAPVVLGAVQTWNVADSGSVLTVSGAVSGGQADSDQASPGSSTSLTITGAGSVTMASNANTFTGDIVVNGGGYNVDDLSDWGGRTVASATSKTITLINGGRLNITTGTVNPGALTTTTYNLIQIGGGHGTIDVASGAQLWIDDAGQLFGTGDLTKTGEGTLRLRNQTAYDGLIDITAGVLQTSGATGGFGTGTFGTIIRSGAALDLNDQAVTDAETVTIYGTGLASAPAGAITNSAVGAASFSGSIVLGSNSTIGAASTGNLTLSGVISGAFDLTVNNVGTAATILTGLNEYTGATVVSAGLLRSSTSITNFDGGAPSWLGASSSAAANLVLDGGTLLYDGTTGGTTDRLFTLGVGGGGITNDAASNGTLNFTNTGNSVASGTGDRTLTLTANGTGTFTFEPSIVDPSAGKTSVAVVIPSTAIMLLRGGSSNYSGDNTLTSAAGGILRVNSTSGLGAGTWTLNTGSILDYQLITNATSATYTGKLLVGDNNVTLRVSNPSSAGAATATIGGITLGSGVLTYARGSNMSTNTTSSLATDTTTLTDSPTINLAAGSGSSSYILTLGALNDGGSARTITVIGAGSGTGDQLLRLNEASTVFTAGTNIVFNGGVRGGIRLDNATAFGTATNYGTINFAAPSTAGGLQLRNNSATNFRTNVVMGDNDLLIELGGTSGTQGSKTHTAGALSIGTATLTLTGALSTAADAVYSLVLLDTAFTGNSTLNVANVKGTATGRLTLGALDDGGVARSISKQGDAILRLSTAATSVIAGTTLTATAGLVELGNATALGAGTLVLGDGTTSGQILVLNGTDVSSTTTVNYAGGWSTLGTGVISGPTSGTGTISGTININATVLAGSGHFEGGGGTLVIAGAIVAGGTSGGEVIIRNGNVRFSQAVGNAYTQLTVNEGTTSLGVTDGIKTDANVRVADIGDATIDFNGFDQTVSGTWTLGGGPATQTAVATISTGANTLFLSGGIANSADSTATQIISGAINLNGGMRTFNIDNGALTSDLTVTASVSNGSISKTGAGILTLSGTNNLGTGSHVNVSDGTLIGSFGVAGVETITVGATGSLQFVNSATESLTLSAAAGALTLGAGARIGFELGVGNVDPGLSFNDQLVIGTGGTALTVAGDVTLDFYNLGLSAGTHTYDLIKADGGGLGNANYVVGNAPLGFNYTLSQTDTLVRLVTEAIIARYWTGDNGTSWATAGDTNWSSTPDGLSDPGVIPGSTETVIFSANNAAGPVITTTLDASFTIEGLQFISAPSGVTAVNINNSGGSSLTLTPPTSSAGIFVGNNAGTITFGVGLPVTVGSNQTWTVTGTGANGSVLIVDADVAFTNSVTKAGIGALTLAGSNTGSGGVTLSAGSLILNSASALGTGALTINAGTGIDTTAGSLTLNNNLQTWNGSFTFAGTNNLNIGTGAVTMGNNVGITAAANELTVGGIIGDGGSSYRLTKLGAGTLTLGGVNTFGGGAQLDDGQLNINNAGALGAGIFVVNGGVIDNTSGADVAISTNNVQEWNADFTFTGSNNLNLGGGAVTFGSGVGTVRTVTVTAGTLTVNGGIGDGVTATGLTKAGEGALTLAGANTYSGNTTVSGGTLNITGTLTGNPAVSMLEYGGTAANTVVNVSNDMTLFGTRGGNVSGAVAVYNQTAGTVTVTGNTTSAVSIANVAGSYGYFNLTGTAVYTDPRRFAFGASANQATQATAVAYIGGSSFLDLRNSEWMLNYSHGHITVADNAVVDRSGATASYGIIMDSTAAGSVYGVLNMAGGSFLTTTQPIRFGNSTAANRGNNNTAMINLAAGTLQVGVAMSVSLPSAGGNNAYLNFAGGTLKTSAAVANWIPASTGAITFTSNIFGSIDNSALAGAPSFDGGLTFDTNGFNSSLNNVLGGATGEGVAQSSLAVTGGTGYIGAPEVIFTGGTLVPGGTPAAGYALISGGAVTGIVITSPGSYSVAPTVTLTGGGGTGASVTVGTLVANTSGNLVKIGEGTLTLSGNNTYTGGTVISGGTLALGGASGTILEDGGAVTINSGATFDVNTRSETVGLVTLVDGSITGTTGVLTGSSYDVRKGSVSAILGGTGDLTKITGDTVTLSGANTFTGSVNVNGGVLAFSASANLGDETAVTNIINLGGGTLQYTDSTEQNLGVNRVVTFGTGTSTVEVASATGILTVSGGVSNLSSGNLVKTGAGILQVTNDVAIDLNGGTVNINDGTLSAGLTDVSALTVSGTGTLALRDNAGVALTLGATAGALTLNDGAVLRLELGNAGNFDSITVASGGTAVTNGTVTLNFLDLGGIVANTYNLIVADSGLDGATFVVGTAPPGFSYSISQTASLVSLTTTAYVPRYWTGSEGTTSWATVNGSGPFTSNWSSTADGLTNTGAIPGAADTVIFSADAVLGSPTVITTTLDAAFTVDSLQFLASPAGVTAVNILNSAGSSLELKPAGTTGGIFVDDNAGVVTLGAGLPVTVANPQNWGVVGTGANGSELIVAADVTFDAAMNKTRAGTLTLSGNNSGTGAISLLAGRLNINSTTALGGGTFSIANLTTIDNTSGGAIVLSGNNGQNWNGSFFFAGSNNLDLGAGAVMLGTNVTVTTTAGNLTVGGSIDDGANSYLMVKAGDGTLTLGGANTHDGGVQLDAGQLNINNAGALGNGAFTINAGSIDNTSGGAVVSSTNNAQTWNAGFTFIGTNNLDLGTGAVTLGADITVITAAGTLAVGVINDGANAFDLTKQGSGTLVVGGASTYDGGNTNIDEGTLTIGVGNALPTGTIVRLGTLATAATLDLNGFDQTIGGLLVQTNSPVLTNNIVIDSGNTLTVNGGVTLGVNTNGSATKVTFSGGGSFVVNSGGANFQVGGATTADRENAVTADLRGLLNFTADLGGGVFRVGDNNGGNPSSASFSTLALAVNNAITAATLDVGNAAEQASDGFQLTLGSGTNTIHADTINIGSAGANIRAGGKLLFDAGDTTGTLVVRSSAGGAGRAVINMINTTGSTSSDMVSTLMLAGHQADLMVSTLTMASRSQNSGSATATLTFDEGTFDVTDVVMAQRTGVGSGDATATLNLGDSAAIGTPTVTIGTLTMAVNTSGGGTSSATLNVTGGTVNIGSINMANAGASRSAVSLINLTGGITTLGGDIVRTGGLGSEDASVILDGGTLNMGGFNVGGASSIITFGARSGTLMNVSEINGGGDLTKTTAGTLVLDGTNTYTGGTVINEGILQLGGGLATGSMNTASAISVADGATFAVNQSDTVTQGTDFGGAAITGAGGFTQAGSGTTVLNVANTYTGKTAVTGGKLSISDETNLGDNPAAPAADQLTLDGGTLLTTATMAIDDSNRGITIGAVGGSFETDAATTLTVGSIITGAGALTKEGTGSLIFTAANTNTGTTTVNAGILGGTGSVGGDLTVATGGTLAPGVAGAGQFTVDGNLALNTGGSLALELGGATANDAEVIRDHLANNGGSLAGLTILAGYETENTGLHDFISIGGGAVPDFSGTVKLTTIAAYNPVYGDIFDLLDWAAVGGATGAPTFDFSMIVMDSGLAFNTDLFAANGIVVVVPEPSRVLLLMLGLLGLMLRRRRR